MYFIEMYAFALYESRVCRDIHVSCNLKTLTTDCDLSPPRRKNYTQAFPLPPKPSLEQMPRPRQNHPYSDSPAPNRKANTPNAHRPPCRSHPTTHGHPPPPPPSNMHSFCGERPPPNPPLPSASKCETLHSQMEMAPTPSAHIIIV